MKILLGSLLAIVSLAWGMDVVATGGSNGGTLPWVIRQEALYPVSYTHLDVYKRQIHRRPPCAFPIVRLPSAS